MGVLNAPVLAATSTSLTVEAKTVVDYLTKIETTTLTTTVDTITLSRPDTTAATGCPSGNLSKVTGACLKISTTDTGLVTVNVPGISKTTTDTVVTTTKAYSNAFDLTGIIGNCLPPRGFNPLTGQCGITVANSFKMGNPDQDLGAIDSVVLGEYRFVAVNPNEHVNWVYGPGTTIGGGIGAIALPYVANVGSSLAIERVDGAAFDVLSLTLFNSQQSTGSAPDMVFTGTNAAGVDTSSDAIVLNQYAMPFSGNVPQDVWKNVVLFTLDGAAGATFYLKDFKFESVKTTVVTSIKLPPVVIPPLPLPVPENDRWTMMLAGLFLLGALSFRRRHATIR
jgi:hypothetical protein